MVNLAALEEILEEGDDAARVVVVTDKVFEATACEVDPEPLLVVFPEVVIDDELEEVEDEEDDVLDELEVDVIVETIVN